MKRIASCFIALGLLLACSFGGVLIWSLVAPSGSAQDNADSGGFGGGFGEDLGDLVPGGFGSDTRDSGPRELHQVWGEVTCLQIDTADLEDLRVGGDLFITPVSEKMLLTPAEKAELLGKLKAKPSFELIGSASLIGIDGGQGLMQMVEEIRYPCEHHEVIVQDRRSGTSHYLPGGYETREAGIRLNWTSNALPDKSVIGIVLLSEASFLGGWFDLGSGLADQPLIISWDQTTCFYLRDGMTLVMTGVPTTAFGKSVALTPNAIPDTMGAKTAVVLVSARILRMPEADDETDQEAEE